VAFEPADRIGEGRRISLLGSLSPPPVDQGHGKIDRELSIKGVRDSDEGAAARGAVR
jgi:hypothetical protein